MIQYQIPQTNITRTIWQTVRRITNEILGVKGLRENADTGQNLICVILLMKIWYNKIKLKNIFPVFRLHKIYFKISDL